MLENFLTRRTLVEETNGSSEDRRSRCPPALLSYMAENLASPHPFIYKTPSEGPKNSTKYGGPVRGPIAPNRKIATLGI